MLAHRLVAQPGDLRFAIAVVVGKGLRDDQLSAEPAQRGEEFCRAANAGEGDEARAGEALSVLRLKRGPQHRADRVMQLGRPRAVADQHDSVGAGEPDRDWFAQRPGRDHAAVTEAVIGIDDDE